MPIFEYSCRGCGCRFEVLVRGSERPKCPECGARTLDKRHSVFAVASSAGSAPTPGACATCGDPRGPGSCRFDD